MASSDAALPPEPVLPEPTQAAAVIDRNGLGRLIAALAGDGYAVIGPHLADGAIAYGPIDSVADLPEGWADEQAAGRYRAVRTGAATLFDYTVGPTGIKRWLFPPRQTLWEARIAEGGFTIVDQAAAVPRYAFLGVRSCDLHAVAVQDRVFRQPGFTDTGYAARRDAAFFVAINCGRAVETCFCTSMGTGPRATAGFDLALTELAGPEHPSPVYLVEAGSPRGAALLERLPHRPALPEDRRAAEAATGHACDTMVRHLDPDAEPILKRNLEHPRWDDVAARCLSCANCTMVCPTCFCNTVEDTTDLAGTTATRERRWDSCFTVDFSYIHGGALRQEPRSRYRQWITHKLAHWHDQFGTSGCVGCGRCITWCPVGIDITEEVRAIRDSEIAAEPINKEAEEALHGTV